MMHTGQVSITIKQGTETETYKLDKDKGRINTEQLERHRNTTGEQTWMTQRTNNPNLYQEIVRLQT